MADLSKSYIIEACDELGVSDRQKDQFSGSFGQSSFDMKSAFVSQEDAILNAFDEMRLSVSEIDTDKDLVSSTIQASYQPLHNSSHESWGLSAAIEPLSLSQTFELSLKAVEAKRRAEGRKPPLWMDESE
ncbi:hypothetical protein ADUPG1_009338 [Aduncisulcus paluster]|uniref:Uncharacterized protein n=1 Tax=Aduncisulcus paluster TaxID=2918883 RepID=A0ABQ5KVA8_9EUKA|nr:hypothetical protein ADUPG1_009338 [Aduncisulcus paluster]